MYNVHIYIIKKHTSNWQIVIWCVNFDSSCLLILLNEHAAAAFFFQEEFVRFHDFSLLTMPENLLKNLGHLALTW